MTMTCPLSMTIIFYSDLSRSGQTKSKTLSGSTVLFRWLPQPKVNGR